MSAKNVVFPNLKKWTAVFVEVEEEVDVEVPEADLVVLRVVVEDGAEAEVAAEEDMEAVVEEDMEAVVVETVQRR